MIRRRPWVPVVYDEEGQRRMVDAVLDRLPKALAHVRGLDLGEHARHTSVERRLGDLPAEAQADITDLVDQLELALLLTKHAGFRDQRETRLATTLYTEQDARTDSRTSSFVRYRPSRYGIAPYLWLTGAAPNARPGAVGTITNSPLPVRGLAISPSANGAAAEASVASLLTACGYADTPVRRSSIPFRD